MTAPSDLRGVDTADVYIDDKPVATLTRDRHDLTTLQYLSPTPTGRRNSIAWTLPRSAQSVRTSGGAIPAFFAGLLPEGVRLGVVTAATKTSLDDHFTLLLAVGSDTIGNIRVAPAGASPPGVTPMVDPADVTDLGVVFRRLSGEFEADPVAIPGVQPKVSAAMWSVPTVTPTGPAILKLTPPTGFPRLVENEHHFMSMAAACGLRTARTRIIHDVSGRSGLLVERFDRRDAARIPQEDACQVLGVYPASKYRIKTEAAIGALAETCELGGGSRLAATLDLLRLVAFSWLIGNGDLHGKNLSIYAPDGAWSCTPAYDLVTTQPYLGWRDPMALNLYGRANKLNRQNFIDAGERLGLRPRAVERMIDALTSAAEPWVERCPEIGFDEHTTDLLIRMLGQRLDSLNR